MPKPGSVVCVSWRDAVCDHDERNDGFTDPPLVRTYGRLLEENAEWVRVAGEEIGAGGYRCITTIPQAIVEDIERLS